MATSIFIFHKVTSFCPVPNIFTTPPSPPLQRRSLSQNYSNRLIQAWAAFKNLSS